MENNVSLVSPYALRDFLFTEVLSLNNGDNPFAVFYKATYYSGKDGVKLIDTVSEHIKKQCCEVLNFYFESHKTLPMKPTVEDISNLSDYFIEKMKNMVNENFNQ